MSQAERIVVVGAGLAGLRSAERLRELGYSGELVIIGSEALPPYHRPALSKQLVSGAMRPNDLILPAYQEIGAKWRLGTTARWLSPRNRVLRLPGGEEITYDGLIIATGVEAKRPNDVPYHDQRVTVMRTLPDAMNLERAISANRGPVAVVGGGFTGCEIAASLRHMGREVTIIGRSASLLGNVLGEKLGGWLTNLHRDHGVDLALGTSVDHWAPSSDGIGLYLSDGTTLLAACVVICAGSEPSTGWLRGSGLPLDNGVVCEATCHVVGADDVVAAGDVAQWPNIRFDEVPRRIEHWLNAVEMGRAAAESLMAGRAAALPFTPMPRFWTEQFGVRIQAAGVPKLGTDTITLGTPTDGSGTVMGYVRDGKLMGVVGLDCPSSVLTWTETIAQQNPAPADPPTIPIDNKPRKGARHSLPAKPKRARTNRTPTPLALKTNPGLRPADTNSRLTPADSNTAPRPAEASSRFGPAASRSGPADSNTRLRPAFGPSASSTRLGPAGSSPRLRPVDANAPSGPADSHPRLRPADASGRFGPTDSQARFGPSASGARLSPAESNSRLHPAERSARFGSADSDPHPRPAVNGFAAEPPTAATPQIPPLTTNGRIPPPAPNTPFGPQDSHPRLHPADPNRAYPPPPPNGPTAAPTNTGTRFRPAEPNGHRIPPAPNGHAPADTGARFRAAESNGHRIQPVPNGRALPVNGHGPVDTGTRFRAAESNGHRIQPVPNGRALPVNGHGPVDTGTRFRPAESNGHGIPLATNGHARPTNGRGPADSGARLRPAGTNGHRVPPATNGHALPRNGHGPADSGHFASPAMNGHGLGESNGRGAHRKDSGEDAFRKYLAELGDMTGLIPAVEDVTGWIPRVDARRTDRR